MLCAAIVCPRAGTCPKSCANHLLAVARRHLPKIGRNAHKKELADGIFVGFSA